MLVTLGALVFEWVFAVRRIRRLRVDQLHVLAVRALQLGVAPPPGVLTAAAPTTGAVVVGWLLLLGGAALACGGGLIVLALVTAAILTPNELPGNRGALVIGGGIIGLLPLALGLGLFAGGSGGCACRGRSRRT